MYAVHSYVTYLVYPTLSTSRTQLLHIVARVLACSTLQSNLRRRNGDASQTTSEQCLLTGSCRNLTKWDVEQRLERQNTLVHASNPRCRQTVACSRALNLTARFFAQTPATRHGVVLSEISVHGNGAETHATTTSIPDIPDSARLASDWR